MEEKEDDQPEQSKLWLVGMVTIVLVVAAAVCMAIWFQHKQLMVSAPTTSTAQNKQ